MKHANILSMSVSDQLNQTLTLTFGNMSLFELSNQNRGAHEEFSGDAFSCEGMLPEKSFLCVREMSDLAHLGDAGRENSSIRKLSCSH
jgi:hypothetical protein